MTESAAPALPVMVFDGDCAFCSASVSWGRRRIRRMPATVPFQSADLAALRLTLEACTVAVQYVDRDARVYAAHDAVAAMLRDAGKGWRVLGALLRVPGIHWLAGVVYRWVARNRHRIRIKGAESCAVR